MIIGNIKKIYVPNSKGEQPTRRNVGSSPFGYTGYPPGGGGAHGGIPTFPKLQQHFRLKKVLNRQVKYQKFGDGSTENLAIVPGKGKLLANGQKKILQDKNIFLWYDKRDVPAVDDDKEKIDRPLVNGILNGWSADYYKIIILNRKITLLEAESLYDSERSKMEVLGVGENKK